VLQYFILSILEAAAPLSVICICVAVCGSVFSSVLKCVLQCVAVRCSILFSALLRPLYVALRYSQHFSGRCALLGDSHLCCSMLQCVAVCCSMLQYVVVGCSGLQCVVSAISVVHRVFPNSLFFFFLPGPSSFLTG